MSQNKLAVVRRLAVRTTIVLLVLLLIAILVFPQIIATGVRLVIDIAPPVTPPPPVVNAPQGSMPSGVGGLREWARGQTGDDYIGAGSGFLLELPGSLRYTRQFIDRRRAADGVTHPNRLYVAESTPS